MKRRSARPWLRYSKKDGTVIEVSMQLSPPVVVGEDILDIDTELALRFLNGELNTHDYLVSLEEQILVERQHARYARTYWFLEDVTHDSEMVELIETRSDGVVLRRKDRSGSSMVVYVTSENNPNALLSRHLLAPGKSKQGIKFDTTVPYSIYARQHVT